MSEPQPVPATTGPTTPQQDLLAATLAGLLPLGAGMLVLTGGLALGFFGGILGVAGAIGWGVWWHKKHGAFFPKDLTGASVAKIAALVGLLVLLFSIAL